MGKIKYKGELLTFQHKLQNRLKALIPNLYMKVIVNYSPGLMKSYYFLDNRKERKFTFFDGNWRSGGEEMPYNGFISIFCDGDNGNAGIFTKENDDVF